MKTGALEAKEGCTGTGASLELRKGRMGEQCWTDVVHNLWGKSWVIVHDLGEGTGRLVLDDSK